MVVSAMRHYTHPPVRLLRHVKVAGALNCSVQQNSRDVLRLAPSHFGGQIWCLEDLYPGGGLPRQHQYPTRSSNSEISSWILIPTVACSCDFWASSFFPLLFFRNLRIQISKPSCTSSDPGDNSGFPTSQVRAGPHREAGTLTSIKYINSRTV